MQTLTTKRLKRRWEFLDFKGNRLVNRIRVVSDSLTKIMEGGRKLKSVSSKL